MISDHLRAYKKQWSEANSDKMRAYKNAYYIRNRDAVIERARLRSLARRKSQPLDLSPEAKRARRLAVCKRYYQKNKDKILYKAKHVWNLSRNNPSHNGRYRNYNRRWRQNNREHVRNYYRTLRKTDPQVMVKHRLRSRIGRVLRRKKIRKTNKTIELIGISWDGLKQHIESLFLPGMSWENRHLWHIDHKNPCSTFDLTDPEQQRKCFHYTNLQPLWWWDNLSKSDKTTFYRLSKIAPSFS